MRPEGCNGDASPALSVGRSFSGRRWLFRQTDDEAARALTQHADISPALAALLSARNVKPDEVADYLNPTLRRLLPEPFLLSGMEKAVGAGDRRRREDRCFRRLRCRRLMRRGAAP
jgi:hypothetical protein